MIILTNQYKNFIILTHISIYSFISIIMNYLWIPLHHPYLVSRVA